MDNKKVNLNPRLKAIATIFLLIHLGILYAFFNIQVIKHSSFKNRQTRIMKRTQVLLGKRGNISFAGNEVVAYSGLSESIYIMPQEIWGRTKKDDIVEKLGSVLNVDLDQMKKLIKKDKSFVWLKRQQYPIGFFDDNLKPLNLPGVGYIAESKRYYDKEKLGSHLVGFVGIDHSGLAGLEYLHDGILKEHNGMAEFYVNGAGEKIKRSEIIHDAPADGKDIRLTIDLGLQACANGCLSEIDAFENILEGAIIIVNANNGQVLAMESFPTFNRYNFNREDSHVINRNVGIHSVVLASPIVELWIAALSRENFGKAKFSDAVISGKKITLSSFDNISMNQYNDLFYNQLVKVGLNTRTGIQLPAEISAVGSEWATRHNIYDVWMTPLQIAKSICILTNGGKLVDTNLFFNYKNNQNEEKIISENTSSWARNVFLKSRENFLTVFEEGEAPEIGAIGYLCGGGNGYTKQVVAAVVGKEKENRTVAVIYLKKQSDLKDHISTSMALNKIVFSCLRYIESNGFGKKLASN
jgi:cell division protein FtsI/penicillin-binding protein 2